MTGMLTVGAEAAYGTPPPATRSKRIWLIALVAVLLIAGAGVVLRNVRSSKATGGELVLGTLLDRLRSASARSRRGSLALVRTMTTGDDTAGA
jgi:hypothetical protein